MINKNLLFFLIFSFILGVNAQDNRLKTLNLLKQYKLDSIKILIDKKRIINKIFKNEYLYLKHGINSEIEGFLNSGKKDYIDSVLYYNYLGDYFLRLKNNKKEGLSKLETQSYSNHKKALSIATTNGNYLLINESLRRINNYFLRNEINIIKNEHYINELLKYKKDSIDNFFYTYYDAMFLLSKFKYPYDDIEKIIIEKKFNELKKQTPNINYHKSVLYHSLGMVYSFNNKREKSNKYYNKALKLYNNKEYYSYSRIVNTLIGKSMNNSTTNNKKNQIKELKSHLNNKFVKKNLELKSLIFDKLHKLYLKINKDSSNYYLKKHHELYKIIGHFKVAIINDNTDTKTEIFKKIKNKNKKIKTLKTKMNTILPILVIITFLLGMVFILYKKYYKKTEVLEEEKSETIKKIDELKQIVIKNHIILKDKTKVYIADLTHIKSDDHYLKVFLSNGKNHFVRGKLNKIIEELPPNFIRCHRSYVVNRNFIKQINSTNIILVDKTELPLSRSFKNKF